MIKLKNKKPFKFTKGGLYIALCCCALVIAAIGYAGNKQDINKNTDSVQKIAESDISDIAPDLSYDYDNDFSSVTVTEGETKTVYETDTEEDNASENNSLSEGTAVSKNLEVEEFKLKMPVEGSVVYSFSGDNLIYNEILSDWRTHDGIDISCDKDSAIYAAAPGVVTDIYDNTLGKNVKIDHQNGYITVYANLSDQIELSVGDSVEEGTLIGKIGSESIGDFSTEPHLHFELLCNDKYLDPTEFLADE